MRIIYCGNYFEGYNSLNKLAPEHEIKMVFLDIEDERNQQTITFCRQKRIKFYPSAMINNEEIVNQIRKEHIDIIISNNFKKIIGNLAIKATKFGGINVHSSLLPEYKGRAPINWAIINGETYTGTSVHFINEVLDGGNIIIQQRIPIRKSDTYTSILDKNIQIEPELLAKSLKRIEKGYRGTPQISEGSIYPYISEPLRVITWTKKSRDIYNLIRALERPFPGAITFIDGKKVTVFSADEKKGRESHTGIPGEILAIQKNAIEVSCKPNNIIIFELEDECGRTMKELIDASIITKGLTFYTPES